MEIKNDLIYLFNKYVESNGNIRAYKNIILALEADLIYKQIKKINNGESLTNKK
jgi:hypothetical protein